MPDRPMSGLALVGVKLCAWKVSIIDCHIRAAPELGLGGLPVGGLAAQLGPA